MLRIVKLIFLGILFFVAEAKAENFLMNPEVRSFIDKLVEENDFDRIELNMLFAKASYQQTALSFYNSSIKPLPRKCKTKRGRRGTKCRSTGSWDIYSHNLLSMLTVQKGKSYMRKHRKTLNRAYKKYGVPPEYITAIIGIESYFGKNTGQYPAFDTLATLAFEPNRRQDFFRSELKAFLLMTRREKIDPTKIKSSYAGAIGLGQFMPSNFKSLAVDFDHDGKIRMNDPDDAIGSIAHYFKKSGWKKGLVVAVPATFLGRKYTEKKTGYQYRYKRSELKKTRPKWALHYNGPIYLIKLERANYDELWYGTSNFYAITRYNHSDYYAMAVFQLAQKIMGRRVNRPSGLKKDLLVPGSDLDNFLDAPLKGRKFIIEL